MLHFGECEGLREVYEGLRLVDKGQRWDDEKLNLLGVQQGKAMAPGVAAVHNFTWKHVIPELVRVETEGARFQTKAVLRRAAQRFRKREEAMRVGIRAYIHKREAREQRPVETMENALDRYAKALEGVAEVDETGQITRTEALERWLGYAEADDDEDMDVAS